MRRSPLRWAVFVTQELDHDGDVWRVRGPRTAALLDGRLTEIKQRVLATLVAATSAPC